MNGLSHVRKFMRILSSETLSMVHDELVMNLKFINDKLGNISPDEQKDLYDLFMNKKEYVETVIKEISQVMFVKMN